MVQPFRIMKRGPRVWPNDLNPKPIDGGVDWIKLQTYLSQHRHYFPYLHDDVIEQWVYRHWEHSPYVHIPLSQMRSEKINWSATDFLRDVGIADNLSDEIGETEVIKKHWQRLLECRPFKGMWEMGTWDFPPLVLYNEAGFLDLSDQLMPQKYWLIEGHKRYRGLNYLNYKGRAQPQHEVYMMTWPGGLPS